jgi:uncharacterized protein YjiK
MRFLLLAVAVGAGGLFLAWPAIRPQGTKSHGILSSYGLEKKPAQRWELPHRLDEISGLALTPDGRLLAHGDEHAVIYQLDPDRQQIVKQFAFGHPPVRGDFEAITVAEGRIFLVTSDGVLYSGAEGNDGEHVPFVSYPTGVGRRCEIEGLAFDPADRSLVLACKAARDPALRGSVALFRWSLDRRALSPATDPQVPVKALGLRIKEFQASDLTIDPTTGHYLLVAARQYAMAELTRQGSVVDVVGIRASFHRQAEGLALTSDGSLLISDEAAGKRATISRYVRVR